MDLDARFSDFKWPDKVQMVSSAASAPGDFILKIKTYVLKSNAASETEIYRLQMLGEFIAKVLPVKTRADLDADLQSQASVDAANSPEGREQFVEGLRIGAEMHGNKPPLTRADLEPKSSPPAREKVITLSGTKLAAE